METVRDKTIDIIISNLVIAGIVAPDKSAKSIRLLHDFDDLTLGETLVESKFALKHYYEKLVEAHKDVFKPNEIQGLSL